MADTEVENILREIRERVRAESSAQTLAPRAVEAVAASRAEPDVPVALEGARARIEANLATIERTWNKLPPLTSYRRGWAARVELWLKRQIKRATHWFTWEQVNFNAAVHSSLRDTLAALAAIAVSEQQLAQAQAAQAERAENLSRLITTLESALESKLESKLASMQASIESSIQSSSSALISNLTSKLEADNAQLHNSLTAVRNEQRERVAYVSEEQRVCFKQLSLEAAETAVAADRARRATEQRLDELAKRIEKLGRT
jgi:hypothetical protein